MLYLTLCADIRVFTDTTLSFSLTLLNAFIDLVSFAGILYSIYPPLFGALLAYSLGGTFISLYLGRSLVGLNFNQASAAAGRQFADDSLAFDAH